MGVFSVPRPFTETSGFNLTLLPSPPNPARSRITPTRACIFEKATPDMSEREWATVASELSGGGKPYDLLVLVREWVG